ncbi:MAG TPA: toxin-antitoxin system HicB family antitoxin [Terracidiphilus sp.]|jgi:hypothetical protein|nr:toxin-antitoxin system HicB family antitoxin [Terracidiphilus sp.]
MSLEYKNHRSFPLRLPHSMHQQADLLARREGISLQAFIERAIGEKLNETARRSSSNLDQAQTREPVAQSAPNLR